MLKVSQSIACLIAVATILCSSALAHAAHPLATDDAGNTGMRRFQIETSGEFGWDKEAAGGVTTHADSQTLTVGVTAGLLDPLDLVVAVPFSWQQIRDDDVKTYDHGGLNDVTLALKWRFLEIGPASFAIRPAVTFPSGDYSRGLGAARPAYGATLISTVELQPVAIHANIGYTRQYYTDVDRGACREDIWNLSLAGAVEVVTGLQAVAEVGVSTNGDKASATWPAFMTGGVVYSVIENLDLSMGIKGGLTPPETDIALLTGLTFRFP